MLTVDWMLIADRSRACVMHVLPDHMLPFPTLYSFVHPQSRLRGRETASDASGRIQLSGNSRAAVEPREDRKHVESRRFANEVATVLDRCRQEGRFDRLIVIAPSMFMGILRQTWSPLLRDRIILEVPKDLLQLPQADLQVRLEEVVAMLDQTVSVSC